jgi:hypothetical protein
MNEAVSKLSVALEAWAEQVAEAYAEGYPLPGKTEYLGVSRVFVSIVRNADKEQPPE